MSSRGAEAVEPAGPAAELEALEAAVRRLIGELREARRAERSAAERAEHSDELLRQFADGTQDPGSVARRLAAVEEENAELRSRIERGRDGVDRILARIRFLEDRR